VVDHVDGQLRGLFLDRVFGKLMDQHDVILRIDRL
jgi:hypothetical protein